MRAGHTAAETGRRESGGQCRACCGQHQCPLSPSTAAASGRQAGLRTRAHDGDRKSEKQGPKGSHRPRPSWRVKQNAPEGSAQPRLPEGRDLTHSSRGPSCTPTVRGRESDWGRPHRGAVTQLVPAGSALGFWVHFAGRATKTTCGFSRLRTTRGLGPGRRLRPAHSQRWWHALPAAHALTACSTSL